MKTGCEGGNRHSHMQVDAHGRGYNQQQSEYLYNARYINAYFVHIFYRTYMHDFIGT